MSQLPEVEEFQDSDLFLISRVSTNPDQSLKATYQQIAQALTTEGPQGPQGPEGPQGPAGANGTNGTNGKTILYGTAAPTTEGVDGDFYIRTSTNFIYGPKASGVWPAGVSITGPTGPTGPAGPALGGSLTTGKMIAGVANVATEVQGLITTLGADGSALPAVGYIGENLNTQSGASCNTSTFGNVAIKTLTVGVYIVGGMMINDTAASGTGYEANLTVKNVVTNTPGYDYALVSFATGKTIPTTFPPRVVVIATGDSNKQIILKARSTGATQNINGYVYAIRIA